MYIYVLDKITPQTGKPYKLTTMYEPRMRACMNGKRSFDFLQITYANATNDARDDA